MAHWKTAIITGGSSGIGRRMAELLLTEGTSVAIIDRGSNPQVMAELTALANRTAGVKCQIYVADVTDAERVLDAVAAAVNDLGKPDFALNCAGIQIAKHFDDLTREEFESVVSVNLFGSRNFAAAVLPHMERGAQLSLIASLDGLIPSYSYSAYNTSKHAVVGLAGALRLDYIERGIEVSVICPPEIDTPMVVEERKTISKTGAKLKDAAGSLALNPACDYILKELKKNQYRIIPGFRARCLLRLAGLLPGVMRTFSERTVIDSLRSEH